MKKISSLIVLAFGLVALASCELNSDPKFNDSDAFVAFDKAAFSCSETDGEISVPVTLASLDGMSTTVSYGAVDGTAKSGVNYELVDGAGTLTFTPTARTQYVKVRVLDPGVEYEDGERVSGLYTGDLKFKLEFKSTGDVGTSMQNACTVTIKDIDHPMSALLGTYKTEGPDYFSGGATVSWMMTITKDASDDHMVWFDNIFGNDGWAGDDMLYYGNVDADLTTITVPLGQESEYKYGGTASVLLLGIDADLEGYESGALTISIIKDASGKVTGLDFGDELGIWAYIPGAGSISIMLPGITATKN
ncbi:MAG: hypothetical protein K5910_09330 [Bacteroidales bacterium]|nr:hypothetical protein [Bacteroidales bacterium]